MKCTYKHIFFFFSINFYEIISYELILKSSENEKKSCRAHRDRSDALKYFIAIKVESHDCIYVYILTLFT